MTDLWNSDITIPLTGISIGNGYNTDSGFRPPVFRSTADIATLKANDEDEEDWDNGAGIAARWPEPFRKQDLDLNKSTQSWRNE